MIRHSTKASIGLHLPCFLDGSLTCLTRNREVIGRQAGISVRGALVRTQAGGMPEADVESFRSSP